MSCKFTVKIYTFLNSLLPELQNKCLLFIIQFRNFAPLNQKSHFVDYLKDFTIHFVGLSIGNHHFDFEVSDRFFEQFEYSQLQHGSVHVFVNLEKQERIMVFDFSFDGQVEVICDRCGEEFMFPLLGKEHLIVKFGVEYKEESEEMIIIPSTEYKIDLSSFIYEYLHLMLPVRIVHPDGDGGKTSCNAEALRRLEALAPKKTIDSRWEALGKITTNIEELTGVLPAKISKKKK